jgi:hypothetical protein
MSVGNLKDYGNKGNNFPFQLATLKGLALSQCQKLQEFELSDPTSAGLKTAIDLTLQSYPDSYLVSKNVIYDGTNYIAFITLATL